MRAMLFCLTIVLSASGCILSPTEAPDCAGAGSCSSCLSRAGCGWCGEMSRCIPGSTFGADEVDCVTNTWRFTSCDAPPSATGCGRKDTCGSCLFDLDDDPDCTWCAGRSECVGRGEACPSGTPVRVYDACNAADCSAQATCDGCLGAGCDWCDAGGGSCLTSGVDCDPHYRFGFGSSGRTCPPPNRCSAHFGCESCLADADCGWCDTPGSGGACQASNGWGDWAGWCSSGSFHTGSCPR